MFFTFFELGKWYQIAKSVSFKLAKGESRSVFRILWKTCDRFFSRIVYGFYLYIFSQRISSHVDKVLNTLMNVSIFYVYIYWIKCWIFILNIYPNVFFFYLFYYTCIFLKAQLKCDFFHFKVICVIEIFSLTNYSN